ncbi:MULTISPECIES: hypothetical protein [Roseivirga]|uniref:Uncharacterized protein n=1 Tax=Roseivirga thermotolerans TaxID=1758176 RepID=A0ABQ3I784_9BACT|nr:MULTISPECIES: hypothetical protein [Roseivirga]MEC7755466.1 hypothetical protein [Bacteroidota bacterium]GHE70715.1 hypothetical protein GCM10011340_28030 [Roseivirga thermotolerans]|tara:strand:+ start:17615 stop:17995 length:381 start_codon:yes stop_codon:yes gene_type:complete
MNTINTLEIIERIGYLLLSWPVVIAFVLIVYRKTISRVIESFTDQDVVKAKVGPIELERKLESIVEKGDGALHRLNQINNLMAKSRHVELEIIVGAYQNILPSEQINRLKEQIAEFEKLNRSHPQE